MAPKYKNIIFLTVDSLRYDYIKKYYSLVNEINVPLILGLSNGPGTIQSFPSLFASSSIITWDSISVPKWVTLVSEVLSKKYRLVGIHSNPFLSHLYNWNRGFSYFEDFLEKISTPIFRAQKIFNKYKFLYKIYQKIYDKKILNIFIRLYQFLLRHLGHQENIWPIVTANNIFNNVLHIYNEITYRKYTFYWIHLMDTHWPYFVPEEILPTCGISNMKESLRFQYSLPYNTKISQEYLKKNHKKIELLKCLYEQSIQYTISSVNNFIKKIGEISDLDKFLIIITSDHGESLGERGFIGHPYDAMYSENLRVPLIIYDPIGDFLNNLNEIIDKNNIYEHRILPCILLRTIFKKERYNPLCTLPLMIKNNINKNIILAESAYIDPIKNKVLQNKSIISLIDEKYKIIYKIDEKYKIIYKIDEKYKEVDIINNDKIENDLLLIINKSIKTFLKYKIKMKIKSKSLKI